MADELHFLEAEDLDPLFWPPSRFGSDSAWYGHVPFAHWLVSSIQPRILVELGTHNGVSYSAFCEAVARLRLPTSCFAVDTWLGDEHSGHYGEDVYEELLHFNTVRYGSFSELLRCTFDEALPYFADNSIDLIHIDGLHTYEAVKHDFESWLPKLSERAVVLFHDTNVRERSFGVWRLLFDLKGRYPAFQFLHGHGLSVVAVGPDVPAAVAALCALRDSSINSIRERFAAMGEHWALKAREGSSARRQSDEHMQTIKAFEAALQEAHSRFDASEAELQEARSRADASEAQLREARSRSNTVEAALQEARSRADASEAELREARSHADAFQAEIESLRAELLRFTNIFGFRLERFFRLIISWNRYDAAYQVWKKYKKRHIERHEALKIIGDNYGVRSFFLLYPIYKTVKPLLKCKRLFGQILSREGKGNLKKQTGAICRLDCPPKIKIQTRPAFDSAKKTMLLVSHDASQTGAPILAFNLLEKFASRYNVISVLLGPGRLEDAFRNISFATIGPFQPWMRYTSSIHKPILRACRKFAPAFAVVNSIESREALLPLYQAKVPSVLLVHEFASLYPRLDMKTIAAFAGQMVFPAQLVRQDAIAAFPWLAARPANIIIQGPSRIPREWLEGETAQDEGKRIAAVMRPLGNEDDGVVVIGCGYFDVRKGIDLFISIAAALQQRSPSRRFRFVWVGKENEDLYSRYLSAQVNCCGLQESMKFLGEVNSLEPVYAMADIFLLSSRLDPFPNVAIDAMLAGLPVVCFSNGSGVAEMLSNHLDLKRLVVPYADASSAAEVIEQLGNDGSYLQTAKAAIRNLALSTFDMDRYVERLGQLAERASLVMKQEEEDFTTISRSDVFVKEYAVPPDFHAPKNTCIEQFVRETAGSGGIRCPFPGFHPGIYRNAHPELNEPPFVNPLAHFIRNGQPNGPWLLDIIRPGHSPQPQDPDQRVALHLHIHYPDLTSEILRSILANQTRPDIYVTVSSEDELREVAETAARFSIAIKDITVVPDRGRNIGPLLTLLGSRLLDDYDTIGHLHAERSSSPPDPEVWRSFCLENLLGGKQAMMDIILDRFARDSKLGIVFPCDPNTAGWTLNRPNANTLLERMGIVRELPGEFFFPVGAMFWARTDAIAPLLHLNLSWNDYPPEPLAVDGTLLHAIERLFPVVAQHRGFEIAGTYVPGVTR